MTGHPGERHAASRGRPPITSHQEVERIGLELFTRNGFEETTMEDIAAAVGISRRTVFRYFPSKNDIVWGGFDNVLERLRALLDATPNGVPVGQALRAAVVASNRYPPDQLPILRVRMALITGVPALQAHAILRYASWREVVAGFVAARRVEDRDALVPQTLAYVTLATAMAAFSHWVNDPQADLDATLEQAFSSVEASDPRARHPSTVRTPRGTCAADATNA